jgi:hypothetical protein
VPLKELTIESEIFEGKDIWTLARVTGADRVALLQAGVTSIDLDVYDLTSETPETSIYTESSISVASTIFDTLQTGGMWDDDDIGYNFSHRSGNSNFTQEGGHTYQFEYELTTSSWGVVPVVHRVRVLSRHRT